MRMLSRTRVLRSAQGPPPAVCPSPQEAAAELLRAQDDAEDHCAAARAVCVALDALDAPAAAVGAALSGLAAALPALELAKGAQLRASSLRESLQAALRASEAAVASRGTLEQRRLAVSILVRRAQHPACPEAMTEEGARLAAALAARGEAEASYASHLQSSEAAWAGVAAAQHARAAEIAALAGVATGATGSSLPAEERGGSSVASAAAGADAADAAGKALMRAAADLMPARAATRTLLAQLGEAARSEADVLARLREWAPEQLAAALSSAALAAAAAAAETPAEDAARSSVQASRLAGELAALSGELAAKEAAAAHVAAAAPAAQAKLEAEQRIDDLEHAKKTSVRKKEWVPALHEAPYNEGREAQLEALREAEAALSAAEAAVLAQAGLHPELALELAESAGVSVGGGLAAGQRRGARFGCRASVRALPGDLNPPGSLARCVKVVALSFDEATGNWREPVEAAGERQQWFMKEYSAAAHRLYRSELRILQKARQHTL